MWRSISSAISPCKKKKGPGLSSAKNKKVNPFIPYEKHVYMFTMLGEISVRSLVPGAMGSQGNNNT